MTRAPQNAAQNPSTDKCRPVPFEIAPVSHSMRALTRNVIKPRVRTKRGIVNSLTTGLMIAFTRPKIAATISRVRILPPVVSDSSLMPLTTSVATQSATALTNNRIKNVLMDAHLGRKPGGRTVPGPDQGGCVVVRRVCACLITTLRGVEGSDMEPITGGGC